MPSKAVAGGVAAVGLAIMIGCAVPMSKVTDKKSTKYKGLIAGVVIGVLMLIAGIAMFFMGGSSNSTNTNSNSTNTSSNSGNQSAAVQQVADPINSLESGLIQQKAAANHMLQTTNNALHTANKLKGALAALATIKK
jgi:flagellar basal body-associated protein FliL